MIARNTQALLDLSRASFDSCDLGKLIEAIYRVTVGRLAFEHLSILAIHDQQSFWRTVARRDQRGRALRAKIEQGPLTDDLRALADRYRGRVHIVDDYASDEEVEVRPIFVDENMRSGLHTYLRQGRKLVGMFSVQYGETKFYTESDARFLFEVAQTVSLPLSRIGDYREPVPARFDEVQENAHLKLKLGSDDGYDDIVGSSQALRSVLEVTDRVSATDATVLILGETGTGKELIARAIHQRSRRRRKKLMTVNCAGLAPELVSSELFGHDAGAFTGATTTHKGRFELADRGTLFLDEVGDIPPETQVRLLRVLEEGEFQRVGSNKTIRTNVRIIAATHRDLEDLAARGNFRYDLLYRLNAFPIHVPPLRDRGSDIIELAVHFASISAARIRKAVPTLSGSTIRAISRYQWAGNVRELRNVIERAVILCDADQIELEHLPKEVAYGATQTVPQTSFTPAPNGPLSAPRIEPESMVAVATEDQGPFQTLEEATRLHILNALSQCKGRISGKTGAAQLLNINPKTLESKMRKLGIRRSWQ